MAVSLFRHLSFYLFSQTSLRSRPSLSFWSIISSDMQMCFVSPILTSLLGNLWIKRDFKDMSSKKGKIQSVFEDAYPSLTQVPSYSFSRFLPALLARWSTATHSLLSASVTPLPDLLSLLVLPFLLVSPISLPACWVSVLQLGFLKITFPSHLSHAPGGG